MECHGDDKLGKTPDSEVLQTMDEIVFCILRPVVSQNLHFLEKKNNNNALQLQNKTQIERRQEHIENELRSFIVIRQLKIMAGTKEEAVWVERSGRI